MFEENRPKYYPVDIEITGRIRIYVKARNEDEVDDAMCGLSAEDVIDDVSYIDWEVNTWDYASDASSKERPPYEPVYSASEESFI